MEKKMETTIMLFPEKRNPDFVRKNLVCCIGESGLLLLCFILFLLAKCFSKPKPGGWKLDMGSDEFNKPIFANVLTGRCRFGLCSKPVRQPGQLQQKALPSSPSYRSCPSHPHEPSQQNLHAGNVLASVERKLPRLQLAAAAATPSLQTTRHMDTPMYLPTLFVPASSKLFF